MSLSVLFVVGAESPARPSVEPPPHVVKGRIVESVAMSKIFPKWLACSSRASPSYLFREPVLESRIGQTLLSELVALSGGWLVGWFIFSILLVQYKTL